MVFPAGESSNDPESLKKPKEVSLFSSGNLLPDNFYFFDITFVICLKSIKWDTSPITFSFLTTGTECIR